MNFIFVFTIILAVLAVAFAAPQKKHKGNPPAKISKAGEKKLQKLFGGKLETPQGVIA